MHPPYVLPKLLSKIDFYITKVANEFACKTPPSYALFEVIVQLLIRRF